MVRRLVMESYGIEKYIDEHLDSTNYRLRLMKYIAPPEDGGNATVGANKDDGAKDNADGDANAKADGTSIGVNVDVVHDVHDNASDHNVDVGVSVDLIVAATDGIKINGDANVDASDGVNANVDAGVVVDGDVDANTGIGISDGVDTNVDAEEAKLGLPCHTDKSLLTILYQHQIEGLEVKTKDDKWIRVKPAPDTLIVMAGDSLCVSFNFSLFYLASKNIYTLSYS
ncbi:PREDICTED: 2-oxoglutarate-dependent dioxygenase AOP3-like [Camelina sativa]|uniref:2-oxoglutarate-dependent dioxygenase AOP3-like n=1 Tax=Camelina sativa TaxID=90675 RepID=A0ABM0Y8S9_CAMSA|nr:PREDICTED: 2-oxoglutarate-dependent dioxygenase AOP3-like [Camelina sativa]